MKKLILMYKCLPFTDNLDEMPLMSLFITAHCCQQQIAEICRCPKTKHSVVAGNKPVNIRQPQGIFLTLNIPHTKSVN
jgi:hypothetical protein